MMKVLMVNGSPHPNGNTATALAGMQKVFEAEGVETTLLQVGSKAIRGCVACGSCREKGKCVFDDAVNEAAPLFEAADGLVVGTPVYYEDTFPPLMRFMRKDRSKKACTHNKVVKHFYSAFPLPILDTSKPILRRASASKMLRPSNTKAGLAMPL